MKSWALRFLVPALFAIGLTVAAQAQTTPGAIKAGKIEGEAFRLTADGQSVPLKPGDSLIETDVVTTGKDSLVVLVFMNGSSVKLGADSKLAIEEFKMDPLAEDIKVADLKQEPNVSKTSLNLAYGEMVGDVKKLNKDSSYNIRTPVGAAGIRGTTFRIVFRPTGDGRTFTFQLATAEGTVVFQGTTNVPANIEVGDQKEIVVVAEATIDPNSGRVEVTKIDVPTATQPISQDNKVVIEVVAERVIQEAVQATVITVQEQQQAAANPPAPPAPPPPAPAPAPAEPTPPAPAPVPTTRPPTLTPGAGG